MIYMIIDNNIIIHYQVPEENIARLKDDIEPGPKEDLKIEIEEEIDNDQVSNFIVDQGAN